MTKAFRRALQSIRQGDRRGECLNLLAGGRQGPLKHLSSLQMRLGKLFHLCKHDNDAIFYLQLQDVSSLNADRSHCLGLDVIVVSWTGIIEKGGLVTTLT